MAPERVGGRPAVFLDRDGVLNQPIVRGQLPFAPSTLEEFVLYPDVGDVCARLRAAGYLLVVVTNQPEINRGTLDPRELDAMHDRLREVAEFDQILFCPHSSDECSCRKPKPGMVFDAASQLGIDLDRSFLIGDRWKDVECAHRAGVKAVFVDHRWNERKPDPPFRTASDLSHASQLIPCPNESRPAEP